jgi:MinD-like ATPase involved in chromosome partitioning or flagellar assembly
VPGAPGLRAVTASDDRDVVASCADHLSRRHAVTLVDAGTRTDHPALGSAHGIVVVGRLSLDGVAQVHQALGDLTQRVPRQRLQVVLVATGMDTGLTLAAAEKLLETRGVPVDALPLDLHLATGVRVSVPHLSDPTTVALTEIAARALDIVTARTG